MDHDWCWVFNVRDRALSPSDNPSQSHAVPCRHSGAPHCPQTPHTEKKTKKSLALAHKAPFNRALVFIGAILPRAQRAARNSGAVHLDVAPSATAAILRV